MWTTCSGERPPPVTLVLAHPSSTCRHSPETWKELWEVEVFPASRSLSGEPGTSVRVWAELQDDGIPREVHSIVDQPTSKLMQWTVTVV